MIGASRHALVLLASVSLIGGCAGGDSQDAEVPAGDVAVVRTAGSISKKTYDHWYPLIARTRIVSGDGSPVRLPKPGTPQGEQVKRQVLTFLIQGEWVEGEARQRGITVSDAEVRRSFEQTRRQAFSGQGGYRRFLEQSGQSQADVLERVRLSALTTKLAATLGTGGTQGAEFKNEWRSRTSCAEDYLVEDVCGNG